MRVFILLLQTLNRLLAGLRRVPFVFQSLNGIRDFLLSHFKVDYFRVLLLDFGHEFPLQLLSVFMFQFSLSEFVHDFATLALHFFSDDFLLVQSCFLQLSDFVGTLGVVVELL